MWNFLYYFQVKLQKKNALQYAAKKKSTCVLPQCCQRGAHVIAGMWPVMLAWLYVNLSFFKFTLVYSQLKFGTCTTSSTKTDKK